jgi:AraC-like DNA-binding protein
MPVDVLSEVLRAVRLNAAVFFDVNATYPWALGSPQIARIRDKVMPGAEHVIPFHFMMSGQAWLHSGDPAAEPILVEAGDVILLPRGDAHCMSSDRGFCTAPDMSYYFRPADQQLPFRVSDIGGGGAPARIVCGYFGCDATPFNPLLEALPRLTIIKAGPNCSKLAWTFIAAALTEGEHARAGGETILAKLSELMLVQAIRMYIDCLPDGAEGWLSGLRDPLVSKVLQLIHADPARDWTLVSLAKQTASSRSVLAERFTRLVKLPPMQYLARWRMQLAANALEVPSASISSIAADVGYQSEAAFNRAFKKVVGQPPGARRRNRQDAAA